MKYLLFAFAFAALIISSFQQELILSNNSLNATLLGKAQSLLKLLLSTPEPVYICKQGDTLQSVAAQYYGNANFAPLIKAGNRDWYFDAGVFPSPGYNLRLPTILTCTQFLSIECIKSSYDSSQNVAQNILNYWKQLPTTLTDLLPEYFTYPNYIYLVMAYLSNQNLNPISSKMQLIIKNNLGFDLTNGRVNYTTGSGLNPPKTLQRGSEHTITGYITNPLKGIQGILTYDVANPFGTTNQVNFKFDISAGNGTIENSFQVVRSNPQQPLQNVLVFPRSNWLTATIADMDVTASCHSNPNPVLTAILNPFADDKISSFVGGKPQNIKSVAASSLTIDSLFFNGGWIPVMKASQNLFSQGWKLIQVDNALHFRILNANSSLALEASSALRNVTLSKPVASSQITSNQIWRLHKVVTNTYCIQANNDLCLAYNSNQNMFGFNPVYLEECNAALTRQRWTILNQPSINYS